MDHISVENALLRANLFEVLCALRELDNLANALKIVDTPKEFGEYTYEAAFKCLSAQLTQHRKYFDLKHRSKR